MSGVTPEKTAATVRYLVPRGKTFALAYPFAIDAAEYREVEVRRLTVKQIADFLEQVKGVDEQSNMRWPLYFANDELLSDEAWDTIDPVERNAIVKAGNDFLREVFPDLVATSTGTSPESQAPSSSAPLSGDTGDSSSEPSATINPAS